MTKNIQETLKGLERIEVKYPFEEKLTLEDAKCLWEAKRIIRTFEKTGEELGKIKNELAGYLMDKTYHAKGYNEMHSIARPILAKALLRIKSLEKQLNNWQQTLAYYTKEDIATPEGVDEFIRKEFMLRIENMKVEWITLKDKLRDKEQELQSLKDSKLTKEEFYAIACEYRPSIAEDSGQPEWTVGELNKMWIGLTRGHWLYINREIKCEKELQSIKEKLTVENLEKIIHESDICKVANKDANWVTRRIRKRDLVKAIRELTGGK